MASITLETSATVPAGESLTVRVEEDSTGDGTPDASATQAIDTGTNTYTLSGFDAAGGNEYRITPAVALSSVAASVSLDSATVNTSTETAVSGTAAPTASASGTLTGTGVVTASAHAVTDATGTPLGMGVVDASAHMTTRISGEPGNGAAAVAGTATATTTASGDIPRDFLSPIRNQELWRLQHQPSGTIDADLYDIRTTEAVNRYASHFVAQLEDADGTKAAEYPRGQRVLAQYSTDGGQTWQTKQAGFVNYFNDTGRDQTDQLEVLFIGYDHFLRRRPVFETFTGVSVSTALQTLITEHTPVTWNAANVEVTNDATFTREIKGEKADEVLSYLASASGGEEYGVNDDFEFYFHPRETSSAPSNILFGDWFDYDLPEEGRQAVNQVRIFYGQAGNRSSVIVEDRTSQRQLKDRLGAPRRVVLSNEAAYPEIDNESAAYAKGREILEGRSPVRTGSVKTLQRQDWEPGDVFRLEIPPKGIDTTFRAAEIRHDWGRGETTMKVAENEGNVTDLLVGMSDEIERIDFREADPAATYTRFLELGVGATVSISGTLSQRTTADAFAAGFGPAGDQAGFVSTASGQPQVGLIFGDRATPAGTGAATTAALNQFRDVWQGATAAQITDFALGSGSRPPAQSDSALETQVHTGLVDSVNASESFQITFEATVAPGGPLEGQKIQEFGFLDSAGRLHSRTVLDTSVVHTAATETSITMTFTVDNDPQQAGVVTDTGQTRLRDMFLDHANTTAHHPTDRAYGTGTADVAETDSALGMKVAEAPITEFTDGSVGTTDTVMRLGTGDANGNDLSELGDENAANELLTRSVFEGIQKTLDFALETNTTLAIRPVIL